MADEPTTTGGADIEASTNSSPQRLVREALWLALILVIVTVLAELERRGLVPWGESLSSLLLLALGVTYWRRFHIRLHLSRPGTSGIAFTYVLLVLLVTIIAIAVNLPRPSAGQSPSLPQMLHLIVLVPLSEELYFRGLLLDHLRRGFGPVRAVVLCSLLFSLLHFPAGLSIQAGILSVIACLLVLKGDTLVYAIQLHVTWNAVSQVTRIADLDSRLIYAAHAYLALYALAIVARIGSSTGDSATRPS